MANVEHLARLNEGVEAWNEWRRSAGRGFRLDLIGADLRGSDLRGANLFRARMIGANLGESRLSEANLGRANLSEASLSGADLGQARLSGARLIAADLGRANLLRADLGRADLIRATLSGADLRSANLRDANLGRADLCEADLSEAKLIEANLGRASLIGANLGRANLLRADLSAANLREADLSDAQLIEANLDRANLRRAYLSEAKLRGANLSKAKCYGTAFFNVDLAEAKHLERIKHVGPSSIGGSTLPASKGRLPKVFLRGCGLTDWEIEAARLHDPTLSPDQVVTLTYEVANVRNDFQGVFYPVFISYSHADSDFADKVHDALQEKGIRCWLDKHDAVPGEYIYSEIDKGIRASDRVLLCCSRDSLKSEWVKEEIRKTRALERESKARRNRLIPLDLDEFVVEWKDPLSTEITERIACNFRDWKDDTEFAREFERLLTALRAEPGE